MACRSRAGDEQIRAVYLQRQRRRSDAEGMTSRMLRWAACSLCALLLTGCLLPKGKPVIVDKRGGPAWSGNGILLAKSQDGSKCRVALRTDALIVEKRWVPCKYVHNRSQYR